MPEDLAGAPFDKRIFERVGVRSIIAHVPFPHRDRVGRYLKVTRNKRSILQADKKTGLEVYVDADFAGNWDKEEYADRDTARSRLGYYVYMLDVFWFGNPNYRPKLHYRPLNWSIQAFHMH